MLWTQTYNPAGNFLLSALAAVCPIFLMLLLLGRYRIKGYLAGLAGLAMTFLLALLIWRFPFSMALVTMVYGIVSGLFPIVYIIFASLLLYNLTVRSGNFSSMRASLEGVTDDRRLQLLIIGFAFIAFLDSAAGFLAPVAITAAMLVGMGFPPFRTAALMAISTAIPAPVGVMGISLVVLSQGSGVPVETIGQITGRILPITIFFAPLLLVVLLVGWRETRPVWRQCLLVGFAYSTTVYVFTNYVSYSISGLAAALAALAGCLLVARYFPPSKIYRFPGDSDLVRDTESGTRYSFISWWPFALLTVTALIWSQPRVASWLEMGTVSVPMPFLHGIIMRLPPVSLQAETAPAMLTVNWLSSIGTAILVTALIAAPLMKLGVKDIVSEAGGTVRQIAEPVVNILAVFALSYLMNYSGMAGTLGLAFAEAGSWFLALAPFLAFTICFTTGSNTATDAMMVGLVTVTAGRLGIPLELSLASFGVAAPAGKMIAPQVLAVASGSAGLPGKEGDILRATLPVGLLYTFAVALITTLLFYFLPGIVMG